MVLFQQPSVSDLKMAGVNATSKLVELSMKFKLVEKPEYEFTEIRRTLGNLYGCTCIFAGQFFIVQPIYHSKKEAKHAASELALKAVQSNQIQNLGNVFDSPSQITQSPLSTVPVLRRQTVSSTAISALCEYCAKSRLSDPVFNIEESQQAPPSFQASVAVGHQSAKSSYRGSKKEAKAEACATWLATYVMGFQAAQEKFGLPHPSGDPPNSKQESTIQSDTLSTFSTASFSNPQADPSHGAGKRPLDAVADGLNAKRISLEESPDSYQFRTPTLHPSPLASKQDIYSPDFVLHDPSTANLSIQTTYKDQLSLLLRRLGATPSYDLVEETDGIVVFLTVGTLKLRVSASTDPRSGVDEAAKIAINTINEWLYVHGEDETKRRLQTKELMPLQTDQDIIFFESKRPDMTRSETVSVSAPSGQTSKSYFQNSPHSSISLHSTSQEPNRFSSPPLPRANAPATDTLACLKSPYLQHRKFNAQIPLPDPPLPTVPIDSYLAELLKVLPPSYPPIPFETITLPTDPANTFRLRSLLLGKEWKSRKCFRASRHYQQPAAEKLGFAGDLGANTLSRITGQLTLDGSSKADSRREPGLLIIDDIQFFEEQEEKARDDLAGDMFKWIVDNGLGFKYS